MRLSGQEHKSLRSVWVEDSAEIFHLPMTAGTGGLSHPGKGQLSVPQCPAGTCVDSSTRKRWRGCPGLLRAWRRWGIGTDGRKRLCPPHCLHKSLSQHCSSHGASPGASLPGHPPAWGKLLHWMPGCRTAVPQLQARHLLPAGESCWGPFILLFLIVARGCPPVGQEEGQRWTVQRKWFL